MRYQRVRIRKDVSPLARGCVRANTRTKNCQQRTAQVRDRFRIGAAPNVDIIPVDLLQIVQDDVLEPSK